MDCARFEASPLAALATGTANLLRGQPRKSKARYRTPGNRLLQQNRHIADGEGSHQNSSAAVMMACAISTMRFFSFMAVRRKSV